MKPPYTVPDKPVWLACAGIDSPEAVGPAGRHQVVHASPGVSASPDVHAGPPIRRFELALDVTCTTPEEAVVLKNQLEGITQLLQKLIAREKQTPNRNDLSGILTSGSFQRQSEHVSGAGRSRKPSSTRSPASPRRSTRARRAYR